MLFKCREIKRRFHLNLLQGLRSFNMNCYVVLACVTINSYHLPRKLQVSVLFSTETSTSLVVQYSCFPLHPGCNCLKKVLSKHPTLDGMTRFGLKQ
eukprot:scaffold437_cov288-Chaetoceros_neogracile.AAC.57